MFIGALALTITAMQPASAQAALENTLTPWTHEASGTIFPRFLSTAERISIREYNDKGTDVSAGYRLQSDKGRLTLTIYVYPKFEGVSCINTMKDAQRAIAQYEGASLTNSGKRNSPSGLTANVAHYARYLIPAGSMSPDYPELVSDLYLYCPSGNNWLVKYRASWDGKAADMPDVPALLQQIGWGPGLG